MLIRKRILTSVKEVNKILGFIDYFGLTPVLLGIGQSFKSLESWKIHNNIKKLSLAQYIIINLKDTKLEITTRYYEFGKPTTYIFDLNAEDIFALSGHDCFKEFSKCYKIPKADTYNNDKLNEYLDKNTKKYTCSASPILGYNSNYEKQLLKDCFEYDLNSAYAATIIDKIPDLWNPIQAKYPDLIKVNKGEIGFFIDDQLTMVEAGNYCDIKFKLIETPEKLRNFLLKWYAIKGNSTGNDKLKAKAMLNLPIGYCQRYNPFLRSYVVNNCNKLIRSLITSETLFWNTDAIFSLKEIPELKIGTNIGEFKVVKCDTLKYIGNVYQINDDLPVYRGISKAWLKAFEKENNRKYDLLLDYDKSVNRLNYYKLDWNKMKVEKNDNEKIN